jgi:hypothetical protein
MSSIQVRPFRRSDREHVTALVNAHVAAVVPGVSVSVNTVLSQLEHEPGEFIVDPWIAERKGWWRSSALASSRPHTFCGTGPMSGSARRTAVRGRSAGSSSGRTRRSGRTPPPPPRS